MLKLVFLDGNTVGDVDLSGLKRFGDLEVFPLTKSNKVSSRIKQADIVITNKVKIDKEAMRQATKLKLICIAATGTDHVDLAYARKKGIVVTNVAGYSTQSVVNVTFAMFFYLLTHLRYYDNYVKTGEYAKSDIFTNLDKPFWELQGKRWGIIGLGNIGTAVARVARCFGCEVVYYSTSGKHVDKEFKRVSLEELLKFADVISIHAPLNTNTRDLITYYELKLMKKTAILLNLGRGGIVNERDLARALNEDLIAAAGLDVLEREPIKKNSPLLNIKNKEKILITPHIAWASLESRKRLINQIILNIQAFLEGKERNKII